MKIEEIAKKLLEKAAKVEEHITPVLYSACAMCVSTAHLEGLKFRFKSFSSLKRKLQSKADEKGIAPEEYAQRITDVLRYTVVSEPETLVNDFFQIKHFLSLQGFRMVECTNTLGNRNAQYRGINTLVEYNGYVFELQFHTPESLSVKNEVHKYYEEYRTLDADDPQRDVLSKKMCRLSSKVKAPDRIEKIQNF